MIINTNSVVNIDANKHIQNIIEMMDSLDLDKDVNDLGKQFQKLTIKTRINTIKTIIQQLSQDVQNAFSKPKKITHKFQNKTYVYIDHNTQIGKEDKCQNILAIGFWDTSMSKKKNCYFGTFKDMNPFSKYYLSFFIELEHLNQHSNYYTYQMFQALNDTFHHFYIGYYMISAIHKSSGLLVSFFLVKPVYTCNKVYTCDMHGRRVKRNCMKVEKKKSHKAILKINISGKERRCFQNSHIFIR